MKKMNIKRISALGILFASTILLACNNGPETESGSSTTPPPVTGAVTSPKTTDNIVVAHRGGSTEAGTTKNPNNSIASLKYAMALGCYASECDIYWTKDNRIVVAHADGAGKINGLYPWESTLAEIRANGTLSNGEEIPTLEEYLDTVMDADGSMRKSGFRICTKLWLDIKIITQPTINYQYSINACKYACEIIGKKNAKKFTEFICTSYASVMEPSYTYATQAGIPIGWMANKSAATYTQLGYTWANLSCEHMKDGINSGARTIEEFQNAGIALSVYTIDNNELMDYYVARADKLKGITTNYPRAMLKKLGISANPGSPNPDRFANL